MTTTRGTFAGSSWPDPFCRRVIRRRRRLSSQGTSSSWIIWDTPSRRYRSVKTSSSSHQYLPFISDLSDRSGRHHLVVGLTHHHRLVTDHRHHHHADLTVARRPVLIIIILIPPVTRSSRLVHPVALSSDRHLSSSYASTSPDINPYRHHHHITHHHPTSPHHHPRSLRLGQNIITCVPDH